MDKSNQTRSHMQNPHQSCNAANPETFSLSHGQLKQARDDQTSLTSMHSARLKLTRMWDTLAM